MVDNLMVDIVNIDNFEGINVDKIIIILTNSLHICWYKYYIKN